MKTIVVPTDFSKYADYALNFASQLAKKTDAIIKLLNIVEYPITSSGSFEGAMVVGIEDSNSLNLMEIAKKLEFKKILIVWWIIGNIV